MSDAELTPEAKDAIRSYMLKLVIPSAAILTVVSGALGFVVSGLARIDASAIATEHATIAAERAIEAAADAKNANLRAAEAAKNADDAYVTLNKAKVQTNQLLSGQYDAFSQALFATKGFRDSLGKIGDAQFKDLNARIDTISTQWHGGGLSAGVVRSGHFSAGSDGVAFDEVSGRVSFPNIKNLPFTPIVSSVSSNGLYQTESCFVKSFGRDYFILWQGSQDTTGRNHPPVDCTFVVIGGG